ncbi:MAG: FCD domain-containing protein, partial [Desulfobacterales bacterium]|nr:FCD domain-containing protein [Desulfobacterales bacterium]
LAKKKIEDNGTAIDEHIEFHNLLARASKNHVFVIVSGSLGTAVRDILTRIMPEVSDDTVGYDERVINSKNTVLYHEKILEAIVERKKERAGQILEEHLKEVERRLQSFIG